MSIFFHSSTLFCSARRVHLELFITLGYLQEQQPGISTAMLWYHMKLGIESWNFLSVLLQNTWHNKVYTIVHIFRVYNLILDICAQLWSHHYKKRVNILTSHYSFQVLFCISSLPLFPISARLPAFTDLLFVFIHIILYFLKCYIYGIILIPIMRDVAVSLSILFCYFIHLVTSIHFYFGVLF